jgi:hypothetical protein
MSEYEHLDQDDLQMLHNATAGAARLLKQIPPDAPAGWRDYAYGLLLDTILRDPYEMDEEDEEALAERVRASVEVAMQEAEVLRDTAFRTLLKYNMDDWIDLRNEE